MRSRAWRWASRAALPLLAAAMDAAWMGPYALLLGMVWRRTGAGILSPLSLLALLALAQGTIRLLLGRRVPLRRAQLAAVAAGVAASVAAVAAQYWGDPWWRGQGPFWLAADTAIRTGRPELPALAVAALAWRRGIVVGRTALEYYDVEAIFHLGLVALAVFGVGVAIGQSIALVASTAAAAFPYIIGFFAASLFALPVARLESVRHRTRAAPDGAAASGDWYAVLAAAVAVILGIAGATAAVLRLNIEGMFQAAGRAVDHVLWVLLYAVALPLGYLLQAIVWLLRHLLRAPAGSPPRVTFPPSGIPAGRPGGAGVPPDAATAIRWGIAAAIAILVVLWLARAVFRYERRLAPVDADESHESVWSWKDLRADWQFRWRRRRRARGEARPVFDSGAAAVIRRAYAQFLGLAAACGRPRANSDTPAEFAEMLAAARPEAAEESARLTALYVRVRYGLARPAEVEVAEARAAVAGIRQRLYPEARGERRDA